MSPSGSLVQPHGPIWPRISASANRVNVGLAAGAVPEPLPFVFTSDFDEQASATDSASTPNRRAMAAHIARLTGCNPAGRLPRSRKRLEELCLLRFDFHV